MRRDGLLLRNAMNTKRKKYLIIGSSVLAVTVSSLWFLSKEPKYTEIKRNISSYGPSSIQQEKINNNDPQKGPSGSRHLGQDQNSKDVILKKFELTSSELESYYKRDDSLEESTLSISGLTINRKFFQVTRPEDLPTVLTVPLPEGGSMEFSRQDVDFNDKDSFVWIGAGKDKIIENMYLSFYKQAIVGHIQTKEGYYEIVHLPPDKQLIRLVDTSKFPKLINDML